MRQFKIIIIFLTLFVGITLLAYGYDTKQRIVTVKSTITRFDQEIAELESKYLSYWDALGVEHLETNSLIKKYLQLPLGNEQQAVFEQLSLQVLANTKSLDATNQSTRSLIDSLDGVRNRRALILEKRSAMDRRLVNLEAGLGARLIFY